MNGHAQPVAMDALTSHDPTEPTRATLAGAAAVVTGASSGIGRAIALALAARGAEVWLVGRDAGRLADAARTAALTAPRVRIERADLASDEALDRLVHRLHAGLEGLDLLVHSAGVIGEDLDVQYRVNVRAPYRLTRALLPLMRARRGQLVFINSSAALAGRTPSVYASTKQALRVLADRVRDEVNGDGVRVLSVYPGRVATPMQERLFAQEGRTYDPTLLLQPRDVADMVLAAVSLPRTAEVTDISMRPARKSY